MSVIVKFKKYPDIGWLKVVSSSDYDRCKKCAVIDSVDACMKTPCLSRGIHLEKVDNVKDRT